LPGLFSGGPPGPENLEVGAVGPLRRLSLFSARIFAPP
jgi:hypothetical protein